jgi:hypothetical protein
MLRYSLRRLAVGTTTGGGAGFSSAAFTGEDGGAYAKLQSEQVRLQRLHQKGEEKGLHGEPSKAKHSGGNVGEDMNNSAGGSSTSRSNRAYGAAEPSSSSTSSFFSSSSSADGETTALERPTIATYEAMSDEQLVDTLHLRDSQIAQLRAIYENFHYEADKHFRKMIFDYHDKTMQLSQVHGKMQQASLQINREALARMRDEQDRMTRDKRLVFTLCTLWSIIFWVWVRRHYVMKRELEQETISPVDRAQMSASVTGAGSYGNNLFGSSSRNARFAETAWEREVRERREAQEMRDRQLALLRHQEEVTKAVAARSGASVSASATGEDSVRGG